MALQLTKFLVFLAFLVVNGVSAAQESGGVYSHQVRTDIGEIKLVGDKFSNGEEKALTEARRLDSLALINALLANFVFTLEEGLGEVIDTFGLTVRVPGPLV